MMPIRSWVEIKPRARCRLLIAAMLCGACVSFSGCVRRYATIIATSAPDLAAVTVSRPRYAAGPTPAYIHEQARFLLLFPEKRTYTLTFDLEKCTSQVTKVQITNWAKSKEDMPAHVTSTVGRLTCEKPASLVISPTTGQSTSRPPIP